MPDIKRPRMRQEDREILIEERGINTGIDLVLREVRRLHDRVRATPSESPGALREVEAVGLFCVALDFLLHALGVG
jgi:hypothetical protein